MRKYRTYTDQDIHDKAKGVYSISGLLKALELKATGGNYINIKRLLQKLNVNCEHWKGQGWNANERTKDWSTYTRASASKKHLIKERGNVCESCERTEWENQIIPLEVHHKDGNRGNNHYDNLQLFCPNCHYLTKGFRNRLLVVRTKEEQKIIDRQYTHNTCICGKDKRKTAKLCRVCNDLTKRKVVPLASSTSQSLTGIAF